jgi:hypothetical protein
MTIAGFDVDSYNKAGFSFTQAFAQGYRVALIKFGGMNMSGNRPYRMNGYSAFVQAAWDAGFRIIGDYMVTGGHDPAGAARYWSANRDSRIGFHELDNEVLDSGNIYSDTEACTYFDTIGTGMDRWMYGSRDALWNAGSWPGLTARKIKAHVAIYNNAPMQNIVPRTYPAELVLAHQFTSSAQIGGLGAIDANVWADSAFAIVKKRRTTMASVFNVPDAGGVCYLVQPGYIHYIGSSLELQVALATVYGSTDASNVVGLNGPGVVELLKLYHLDEFTPQQVYDLPKSSPATLVASWLAGSVNLDEASAALVASKVTVPSELNINLTGKAQA